MEEGGREGERERVEGGMNCVWHQYSVHVTQDYAMCRTLQNS